MRTKKDTKIVWSAIRSIVNVKETNRYQPSNLIIENKTVSNLSAISNHFNYFFTNIAGEIYKTIGPSNKTRLTIYPIQKKIPFT